MSGDFQVVLKNILLSMTDGVIELQVFPNGLFSLCSYIYTQPTRIHFVIGWTELKDFQCLTQQYVVVLFELILWSYDKKEHLPCSDFHRDSPELMETRDEV